MSKCEPVIADKITTETRLGQDCQGNPVYGGATFATCQDIPEVIIPKTCDGNPVTNETKLATCEELHAVEEKAEQDLSQVEQELTEAINNIVHPKTEVKAGNATEVDKSVTDNTTTYTVGVDVSSLADGTTITVEEGKLQANFPVIDDSLMVVDFTEEGILVTKSGVQYQADLDTRIIQSVVISDSNIIVELPDGTENTFSVQYFIDYLNSQNIADKLVQGIEIGQYVRPLVASYVRVVGGAGINVKHRNIDDMNEFTINNDLQIATEEEIDLGTAENTNKVVSAEQYRNEILIERSNVVIGNPSTLPQKTANVFIGNNAGNNSTASHSVALGNGAGRDGLAFQQVAIGAGAGEANSGRSQVAIGVGAGEANSGRAQVAVGYNSGVENNAETQTDVGAFAGSELYSTTSTRSFFSEIDKNKENNRTHIGFLSQRRDGENNYVQLGNEFIEHVYSTGVFCGAGFAHADDERVKKKIELLNTLPNGIEVWKCKRLDNGTICIGWIAQQVEEVLRAKGYDQEIIELVIPRARSINFQSTLTRYSEYESWDEVPHFDGENEYYHCDFADDIRSINKDTVRDLLGM